MRLDNHPTTLILGENGNGKSLIIDALSFVLYGKPFRKINKGQLVNSINKSNLETEVEFSVGRRNYKIRRGIRPNYFEVFTDGKLLPQPASIRDYQVNLEKNILKMNFKSFSQIIVLGTSTFVPFMDLPTPARRGVIEDLLDIEIFTLMNNLLKDDIYNEKNTKKDLDFGSDKIALEIRLLSKHLFEIQNINKNRKEEIERKIEQSRLSIIRYRGLLTGLNEKSNKLMGEISNKGVLSNKSKKLAQIKTKLTGKNTRHTKNKMFFETNDSCPTCGQVIDENFRKSVITGNEVTIKKTEEYIEDVNKKIDETKEELSKIVLIQNEIIKLNNEILTLNSKITSENTFIINLKNEIIKAPKTSSNKDSIAEQLTGLKTKRNDTNTKKKENSNKLQTMMNASVLLKDGGIKARIIKQYIPIINSLINKYLAQMNFYCSFNLDENFNETIKSRHRDEFSFHSFSEGEKLRVSLAILFCWRSIAKMRNSVSTNLLILDEVLDASLDQNGIDDFLKIIEGMRKDTNIIIISHKTDNIVDKFSRVITVTKHKNFSKMNEND